jgi:TM2 domain-containing membrane protein YozV
MNRTRTDATAPSTASRRRLATMASLFVPGAGHFMLGRGLRGAVWLVGFLALALLGAAHLLPGLVLMVLAALDTWWIGAPEHAETGPKAGAP